MKTLVVQKLDRDVIPAVYADQSVNYRQFTRGDVIDVLPGRREPSNAERAQDRWCFLYVNGLGNDVIPQLMYDRNSISPGALRPREFYMDLDQLGVGTEKGFATAECTPQQLLAAIKDKPMLKAHWIIG